MRKLGIAILLFPVLSHGLLPAQEQAFSPKRLESTTDLVNPLRGLYTWLGLHDAPQPEPALDSYRRIPWTTLEPEQSRYDFSAIETELSKLPKGGRFAFRVISLNPSWNVKDGSDVPPYLMAAMPKAFYIPTGQTPSGAPKHLYIPDWNSPAFLDRAEKLLAALGGKYDGDPRISFVDIGVYGTWGEWHTFGIPNYAGGAVPYSDARLNRMGAEQGTLESRKRIVNAHANAFKKTRMVMMTDDKEMLLFALNSPTQIPIGIRRDSFGARHFSDEFMNSSMTATDQQLVLNRWRTAPFVVESFGGPRAFQVGPQGLAEQVETYHVSAVGNGGFGKWGELTSAEQQGVLAAGRRSGYRLAIASAALSGDVKSLTEVPLRTQWVNEGVAPTYEPWTVEFTVWKDGAKVPVAHATSTVALGELVPSKDPKEVRDVLKVSSKWHKGTYELRVKVSDPACYRNPMRLAIEGLTSDGSYTLGTFRVD